MRTQSMLQRAADFTVSNRRVVSRCARRLVELIIAPLASRAGTTHVLWAYAAGGAFVGTALWARWALDPHLGDTRPLSLLFGAVALAVWIGGIGPALCATALGYFSSDYLFLEPRGVIAIRSPQQVISLVTYCVSSAVIISFGEALRRANARVRSHARALELKQRQLQAAQRHKDDFIATLAHELRSPLAAIQQGTIFVQQKYAPVQQAKSALEIIERQTRHMSSLIEDLLDLSRISRGEMRLDRRAVSIADVVRNAAEIAGPSMQRRRHLFHTEGTDSHVMIDGDQVRLTQVIVNLLNNAARYTPEGGTISVVVSTLPNDVLIAVRDNGIGLQPDMLERVFEMFVQGNGSGEHGQRGLGIGLSLVKQIIALHGGSVTAHSQGLGCGSEFVIRLPLTSRAQVTAPRLVSPVASP
jgi:signal transduction histidine kinase